MFSSRTHTQKRPHAQQNAHLFVMWFFFCALFLFFVRGLKIATGQYSSFCVSAVVLTLGGVDMEDGEPGREQEECGREEVEDGEKQERETNTKRQQTHAQTFIMDGMQME